MISETIDETCGKPPGTFKQFCKDHPDPDKYLAACSVAPTNYVAGFLFTSNLKWVTLIEKNKPRWQKGFLNGVGGKIEAGETPLAAMVREFEEETGARVNIWHRFAVLTVPEPSATVTFFRAIGDCLVKTLTDEKVFWYPVRELPTLNVVPNLRWLIPLALDSSTRDAVVEAA